MRAVALLPLAVALAHSFVIPDSATAEQLALSSAEDVESVFPSGSETDVLDFESYTHLIAPSLLTERHYDYLLDSVEDDDDDDPPHRPPHHPPHRPPHPPRPPHRPPHHPLPHHGPPPPGHGGRHRHDAGKNLTAYQLLSYSNHTRIFNYLLKTYSPSLVSLLNTTEHNVTLFTPLDAGFKRLKKLFDRLPDKEKKKHKKPSNETIDAWLHYHVVLGKMSTHAITFGGISTLPSLRDGGAELGGNKQRIRVEGGLGGVRVNWLGRVVFGDYPAKNGLLHFTSMPLLPPPSTSTILNLVPTVFSTLALALEKTGLGATLNSTPSTGGTFFAPTNRAWKRLPPAVNAWLFSKDGLPVLEKLLRYHVSANQTLYTDAFYGSSEGNSILEFQLLDATEDDGFDYDVEEPYLETETPLSILESDAPKDVHVDLPSMLHDLPLAVDIKRFWFAGRRHMIVNRKVHVRPTDALAKDGVVQVVGKLVMPPCKKKEEDMTIDDLAEMFADSDTKGEDAGYGEL